MDARRRAKEISIIMIIISLLQKNEAIQWMQISDNSEK